MHEWLIHLWCPCTAYIQRFAGWLSTGEGKWAVALKSLIRLGCLFQRLTVYTVATVNSHLPIALDNQPANLCSSSLHLHACMLKLRYFNCLPQDRVSNSKQWNSGYSELLDMFSLSTLENRRLYLKLCHLFKIVRGLCYFPPDIVVPRFNHSHFSRSYLLQQPFARTNSFYSSFIPDSIRKWNFLPEDIVCAPTYCHFNRSLRVFT